MTSAAFCLDAPPTAPSSVSSIDAQLARELVELGCGRVLGDYTLLRKVATGGMAEVFVARPRGASGYQARVAIKKILPQHAHNQKFITMIVDEAKVCATLVHPNIARLIELAAADDNLFLVMEYVDGLPLSRVLLRARERGVKLVPELAAHVVSEVAKGLDYAHRHTDARGSSMMIVHRDVSPQNILLSYAGDVKLIDFGIARAEGRAARTGQGIIKGKLKYLAPEIANGDEPDHRADVYCCGLVLFEALTGEPMFTPLTDLDAIEMAREARVRSPRAVNPAVPGALDEIVMRALRRDRNTRHQSARELQHELRSFLARVYPAFTGESELTEAVFGLFGNEIHELHQIDAAAEMIARAKDAEAELSSVRANTEPVTYDGGPFDAAPFESGPFAGSFDGGPSAHEDPTVDAGDQHRLRVAIESGIAPATGVEELLDTLRPPIEATNVDVSGFKTEITELGTGEEVSFSGFAEQEREREQEQEREREQEREQKPIGASEIPSLPPLDDGTLIAPPRFATQLAEPPPRRPSAKRSSVRKPKRNGVGLTLALAVLAIGGSSFAIALSIDPAAHPVVIPPNHKLAATPATTATPATLATPAMTAMTAMTATPATRATTATVARAIVLAVPDVVVDPSADATAEEQDEAPSAKAKGPQGSLRVKAVPQATILVDGKRRGKTPRTLSLRPGMHEIVLESPSGARRRIARYVTRGKNQPVVVYW